MDEKKLRAQASIPFGFIAGFLAAIPVGIFVGLARPIFQTGDIECQVEGPNPGCVGIGLGTMLLDGVVNIFAAVLIIGFIGAVIGSAVIYAALRRNEPDGNGAGGSTHLRRERRRSLRRTRRSADL